MSNRIEALEILKKPRFTLEAAKQKVLLNIVVIGRASCIYIVILFF